MNSNENRNVVECLSDIFDNQGAVSYLGEVVTMSEHMLQAAHQAERASASRELVAASLLHDIGFFVGRDEEHHGESGAAFLSRWFPKSVTELVRLHVEAKRYLCSVKPSYFDKLSSESKRTLEYQGGVLSKEEILAFEAKPYAKEAIELRRFDDLAKMMGQKTSTFKDYRPLLETLIGN